MQQHGPVLKRALPCSEMGDALARAARSVPVGREVVLEVAMREFLPLGRFMLYTGERSSIAPHACFWLICALRARCVHGPGGHADGSADDGRAAQIGALLPRARPGVGAHARGRPRKQSSVVSGHIPGKAASSPSAVTICRVVQSEFEYEDR